MATTSKKDLLQLFAEARYQHDPREQFLNNFFVLEDEDDDGDFIFQMWFPKKDILVTAPNEFAVTAVDHIVSSKSEGTWSDSIFPSTNALGGGDPLPDDIGLQDLSVWKKIQ